MGDGHENMKIHGRPSLQKTPRSQGNVCPGPRAVLPPQARDRHPCCAHLEADPGPVLHPHCVGTGGTLARVLQGKYLDSPVGGSASLRAGGRPPAPRDRRGPHVVPRVSRGAPTRRRAPAPVERGHKTLPLRPEPRYNSCGPQASGSVRPVLPGGLASAVVALFSARPPG